MDIQEQLKKYYKNKQLSIVGLNDSQGVDTQLLIRKGILEYLRDILVSNPLNVTIFNAFSLMFNKTEHIDYLIESNLSLEEIKALQIEGTVSSLEKFFHKDLHIPEIINLGNIGYISSILYKKNKNDKFIFLSDTIKYSDEAIVIYSCGANDLMREAWVNPFSITKAYKNRFRDNTYNFALQKYKDPNTVKSVINRVEKNIYNILSLNGNVDIATLGIYLPASLRKEGMEIFAEVVEQYNIKLEELCQKYHLIYVDNSEIGKQYNKNETNFHVKHSAQVLYAKIITEELLKKKNNYHSNAFNTINLNSLNVSHNSLEGLKNSLQADLNDTYKQYHSINQKTIDAQSSLSLEREKEINNYKALELERQIEVVDKVMRKEKKR